LILSNLTGQNDPLNYTFNNLVNQSFSSTDGIFGFQSNVRFELPIAGTPGLVQMGVSARIRNRSFDQTYTGRAATDPNGTANSLFLNQVLDGENPTIYSGKYHLGPQISTSIGQVLAHSPQYSTSVDESLSNAVGTWSADENVFAGYAMYTITFDKLTLVGGLRIEGTDLSYNYNKGIFDATNALVGARPADGRKDYANILTNLQLKYDITPNLVARLGYSKSIAVRHFSR
jgi:hypothetical protein